MRELLVVQGWDTTIDQRRHALEHLPEREALKSKQARMAELAAQRAAVQSERDELARQERRFEDEASTVEAKASDIEAQLYGGGKSIRELEAFQADLASLKRRQAELEDHAIELMERVEPIDAHLAGLDSEITTLQTEADDVARSLLAAETEIQVELDSLAASRAEAATGVPEDVLARYDRLRPALGGVAVAELQGARCSGCHLALSAVDLDQIRKLPADASPECPECGRLLVR